MKLEPKHRVFYHELGHYVSSLYNHEKFKTAPALKIVMYKDDNAKNVNDFIGECIYMDPEKRESVNPPLTNVPQKLGRLVYGCYFQCLMESSEIVSCFNDYLDDANGWHDRKFVERIFKDFNIGREKLKLYYQFVEMEYFETLRHNSELKACIFDLNPENYLIKINDSKWEVDLQTLTKDLTRLLDMHRNQYFEFMERIFSILDWDASNFEIRK